MKTEIVARLIDGTTYFAEDIHQAEVLGTDVPAVCLEQATRNLVSEITRFPFVSRTDPADIIVPVSSLLSYYRREKQQEGAEDNE